MIDLQLDVSDFERQARHLGGALDQVPFALSVALNKAASNARQVLIEDTWPRSVTQRSPNFPNVALSTNFSTKQNLRVEIYDKLDRAHLKLHVVGGTKLARNRLAIPPRNSVVRTAHGVRKDQTPHAIIAATSKRALRITARGIFVGMGGRLVLKYLFRNSVQQPADVPFEEAFADAMLRDVRTSFPRAMAYAMRTRR